MRLLRRLLLTVVLVVVTSAAGHADQLDTIRAAGELRAAVSDNNPPFSFVDPISRAIIGYDVDFARAIAAGVGVKLQLVPAPLADRTNLLRSGKVDLITAEMTITPERAKTIAFSIPYFVVSQQLVALASTHLRQCPQSSD